MTGTRHAVPVGVNEVLVNLPDEYVQHLERRGFRPLRIIGSGLSGTVVEANQNSLARAVAVKFCDSLLSRNNPTLRKRFQREAQLLARIHHAAIPYVLTTGVVPKLDVPYTVLQFIPGRRLRDDLGPSKTLEHDFCVRLMLELLDALRAAHEQGIIHRDVSPENIMVSSGRCVLIDFSIGVSLKQAPGLTRATPTGQHLGRADYMAPEQGVDMARTDQRSDLYSAAVVFLEMLTGSPKFPPKRLDAHLAELNPDVRDLLKRALAQDPANRFPSAREFSEALRPFSASRTPILNCAVTAVCASLKCSAANWSPRGYYRGPKIYEATTDTFCESCGVALKRTCSGCGASFRNSRHCGDCGAQWYSIPTCETCGSYLQEQDVGTDTKANCCTKGRRKNPRKKAGTKDDLEW